MAEDQRKAFGNFGYGTDYRKIRSNEMSDYNKDLYSSLINIILNHKSELQKIPGLASPTYAHEWAKKRGYTSNFLDVNKDGTKETVIYNKAGQPIIINGYKPRASDYRVRYDYYEANPNPEDRLDNPMSEWARNTGYYNIVKNKDEPWKRTISKTPLYKEAKAWGYKLPTKPKKEQTPFAYFSKLIKDRINTWFKEQSPKDDFNNQTISVNGAEVIFGGWDIAQLVKKVISPISLYRALYTILVERSTFYELIYGTGIKMFYKEWKVWKKAHKDEINNYFFKNFLRDDKRDFSNRITLLQISSYLCHGKLNKDESDPNDIIVFLLGKENLTGKYKTFFDNNDAAARLLQTIKNPDGEFTKAEVKQAKKVLLDMKKNSQTATKEWFNEDIKYFFEDDNALARYVALRDNGKDPNVDSAYGQVSAEPQNVSDLQRAVNNDQVEHTETQLEEDVDDSDDEDVPPAVAARPDNSVGDSFFNSTQ